MIFNMTGGGMPLNFRVIGGTILPDTARKNDIWVDTDADITGFFFSPQEPEAAEGLVWLKTSDGSDVTFNALKKNGLILGLFGAFQCVNGDFSPKDAQIYDGTSWTSFSKSAVYLYLPGDTCDALTGGWVSHKFSAGSGYVTVSEEIASTEAGMTVKLEYTSGKSASTFIGTKNKISPEASRLHMEFSEATASVTGAGAVQVCLFSDEGYTKAASADILGSDGSLNLSAEIDVSELSGEYYIGFLMWKWQNACIVTATMKNAMFTE